MCQEYEFEAMPQQRRDSKEYFSVEGVVFPRTTVVLSPAKGSRNRGTDDRGMATIVGQFELSF